MCASAALAAPQAPPVLPFGAQALAPAGFVDFCRRQPEDCGDDPTMVLEGVRRAEAARLALLATAMSPTPASVGAEAGPRLAPAPASLPEPVSVLIEAADRPGHVEFVDPADRDAARRAVPRLTPDLWARLNTVNERVNRALNRRSDLALWGRQDVWSTPLKTGQAAGDCEDFVLEKRRALLEAGVPARALNIAVVTTRWGETHAVLLVATHKGEFVLDNLSPWVAPWREAPYRWRERQVDGEAFVWAMAVQPPPPQAEGRVLIAALR